MAHLALRANLLAAALGAFTLLSYLFLYTPLKQRTPWATVVGAVPGALPPMIGWAAASGRLDLGAWVLFGIVFLWQLPHFMAIAWIYRDDYERGGFAVLPTRDAGGGRTSVAMVAPVLLLIALTTAAPALGLGASVTIAGGLLAGVGFLVACLALLAPARHRDGAGGPARLRSLSARGAGRGPDRSCAGASGMTTFEDDSWK